MIHSRFAIDEMTQKQTDKGFVPFPLVCIPIYAPWQESLYRWAFETAQTAVAQRPAVRDLFVIMN
jgi:hypothetical protein